MTKGILNLNDIKNIRVLKRLTPRSDDGINPSVKIFNNQDTVIRNKHRKALEIIKIAEDALRGIYFI